MRGDLREYPLTQKEMNLKQNEGNGMRIALQMFLFVMVIFLMFRCVLEASQSEGHEKSLSAFPIFMYDTDIGFGYGGKAKCVNYLGRKESFDIIVFNSTKGERWYVFTFSILDTEIRQGKKYPISFDLRAEYDRYMAYNFFGIGPDSQEDNLTTHTYTKRELLLTLGRGFSPHFIVETSYAIKSIRVSDVEEEKRFTEMLEAVGDQFSPFAALAVKYDTSDSQIHPRRGFRLIVQNDIAGRFLGNENASYHRISLDLRRYLVLLGEQDVLAARFLVQKISGEKIPHCEMPMLGGGSTMEAMRGYKMSRFRDRGKFMLNVEYRFPIWRSVGGNVFLDAGCVWPAWSEIDLTKSVFDAGWGLRYYLKDFIVRFDMGISREGMGVYFNFGHVF